MMIQIQKELPVLNDDCCMDHIPKFLVPFCLCAVAGNFYSTFEMDGIKHKLGPSYNFQMSYLPLLGFKS